MKGATHEIGVNKRQRKPNGESRMDNPETLATLGTQDRERKTNKQNTKNKNNIKKTQNRKLK